MSFMSNFNLNLNRPISITSVLSKVFESLVSVRLGGLVERSGVSNHEVAYRKGLWVPVMHIFTYPIHCRGHSKG